MERVYSTRRSLWPIVWVAVVLVVSCGGGAAPQAQSAGGVSAVPSSSASAVTVVKATLRLDYLPSGTQAPFFLAQERGYFSQQGIDIDIQDGRGSGVTVQSIGNGQDTFGWAAVSAIALGIGQGLAIKSIAMITNKNSYGVFVDKASSINTLQDLYGKTILVVAGAPDGYTTTATLALNHLDASKVTLRAVDASSKVNLYTQGVGDGMVTTIPFGDPLVQPKRPSKVLRWADYGLNLQDFGLIASTATIRSEPGLVRRFVSAALHGWKDAQADPHAAVQALVKHRPNVAADLAESQLKLELEFLSSSRTQGKPLGCASAEDWKDTLSILKQYANLAGDTSNADRYYTNEFVSGC